MRHTFGALAIARRRPKLFAMLVRQQQRKAS